jgi:hypothetical protein
MDETMAWLRRSRYSPFDLAVLLLLMGGGVLAITYGTAVSRVRRAYAQTENQRGVITPAIPASTLPAVRLAPDTNPNPQGKTFRKEYTFSRDYVTRYLPLWEKAFEPYKGKPGVHYLEIGAFEGGSVIWLLENILTDPTAHVTAIDLFDGPYKDTYLANIELSGCADKVTSLTGFSQVVLRGLPLESFDVIYVDGSHLKSDTLEDAVLSWRLLKVGGLMIFDDYRINEKSWDYGAADREDERWCPRLAIDPFVHCFDDKCEVIHNGRQLIIRKKT